MGRPIEVVRMSVVSLCVWVIGLGPGASVAMRSIANLLFVIARKYFLRATAGRIATVGKWVPGHGNAVCKRLHSFM